MATNDVLLKVALNNLDVIGNAIGGELGAVIAGEAESEKNFAEFKDSVKKTTVTLKGEFPDKIYEEVMDAYYDALKEKDAGKVLDELHSDDKNLTERIKNSITMLVRPVDSRKVDVTDDDGNTDTYKISFPLSGVGIDSVALITKDSKFSLLSWETETDGKIAMFKYFLSLWNLEQKLSDEIFSACYNFFKTSAADFLKATYSNVSADDLRELLNSDSGTIKTKVKAKIKAALPKDSYLNSALTSYGSLTKLYNKLQKEINSSSATYVTISKATTKFLEASNSLVSSLGEKSLIIDIDSLPDVLDPIDPYLKYNTSMTEVSVLSGHGDKLEPTDYNSRVKTINASVLANDIEITGNTKANVIYSGTGNDTILGGKGNDSLWGDAGNDSLYGGAGNDDIYGYEDNDFLSGETGNDKIYGYTGDDILLGGAGNDSLWAGDGKDSLFGEAGNDRLIGELGNNTLVGGKGSDSLWGGTGEDIFYYENGDGKDVIIDYAAGEDKIFLASGSIDKVMISGKNVIFKIGTGSIKVKDAKNEEITFAFADGSESKYLSGELISTDQK